MVAKMNKAKHFLDDEAIDSVKAAIAAAEKDSAGEVVVVVAKSSGRYDRAEDIFGLLLAILLLAVTMLFFTAPAEPSSFARDTFSLGIVPSIVVIIIGFMAGSSLATYFPLLKLPFIPKKEMKEEVNRRALECFYNYGIGKTSGATGILIYVSLFERRVVVKGDSAISEKLRQDHWDKICGTIIDGLKGNQRGKGFVDAINKCGELLREHFPASGRNPDELANEIYFID